MKNWQYTNNYSLKTSKPYSYIKNGLQDINRPNLYLINVPGITFAIVFVYNKVLHISWKFHSKIFHVGWFIKEKPFSWITAMSDDSNN